ncbi:hypothetical protein G7Z17_g11878 [Cylindrodendrum hubeiense]|uniref:Major facilitator superfamily (MFS) profile domain-containing protein n=1 Tax=Cylindrodendrum hubeiense TaxID=595255 RepID=A0A9P5H056_9HYPO|nr:hypothetical protein G7Z17_g11878 [Cylindrodendrum hubeiense]
MFLQKFIRNESIKTDPPEIYNLRTVMVSLVACGGALLFGMDMGVIGGVLTMDTFKEKYGLLDKPDTVTANLSSNIVSVIQAGAFAGCIFSMWLANKIGRRLSLIWASILVFVGVALQAAANGHIASLYVGRFITGIAIGIASTVNPLYVAENAPRGIRGLLTGCYQLSIVTGLTLAFWNNYGCLLHIKGPAQYIIPLSLQALPAVILLVGMLFANESPRFLAQKTPEKALLVLAELRGLPVNHPYIRNEMDSISSQLEEERALAANSSGLTLIKEAFTVKSYRRRSFLCITLMMWSNLTGTNAMTYYSPTIFKSIGLSSSQSGLLATGVYGIVKMEIPAARMRAFQMGMATASQWLFNFVVAKATPTMFATLGQNGFGTYFVYGSFCFTMVVFAWFFVPETKGLSLEDMDELFAFGNVRGKFIPTRLTRLEAERNVKEGDDKFEHHENA